MKRGAAGANATHLTAQTASGQKRITKQRPKSRPANGDLCVKSVEGADDARGASGRPKTERANGATEQPPHDAQGAAQAFI